MLSGSQRRTANYTNRLVTRSDDGYVVVITPRDERNASTIAFIFCDSDACMPV